VSGLPAQWRFVENEEVYSADDVYLGNVLGFIPEDPGLGKPPDYLIVEKGLIWREDVFIPTSAVANYRQGRVELTVTRDEAVAAGWEERPPGR
jgi:hypothetical protein